MQIVTKRYASVTGYSDEFIEALWQLSKERGGGYIPVSTVEARAATLRVIPKVVLPPLPLINLPPLPVIR